MKKKEGFSYQKDAPLDMRMDNTQKLTAWDVVNTYSEEDLERIIWNYGEDRWAKRIAQFIVNERREKPIDTTLQLVDIIKKPYQRKLDYKGIIQQNKHFKL